MRPYNRRYHPHDWRGWFDFGTGALGDMAIHNMDPAFYALDLGAPSAVEAKTSPLKPESYPAWTILRYEFAARGDRPALTLTWYDGGKMPPKPRDLGRRRLARGQRHLLRRRQGDDGLRRLVRPADPLPREPAARSFTTPAADASPARSATAPSGSRRARTTSPRTPRPGFDYSGPFTEALLVGNLALRLQTRVEWDPAAMRSPNAPDAEPLIRKRYRDGFGIGT